MSAVGSGIARRVLRKRAVISDLAADAMTFFIIVVRYKMDPLMMPLFFNRDKRILRRNF